MDYFESQCAHCSKVFTSEKGLKKHKFENHYLIDNAYDCDECGKRFESQVKLKVHTRSHKIKNCELCNVVVTEKNYTRHKKEKHLVIDQNSNPQEFKCGICGQAFTRKDKLERHSKSCGSMLKQEVEEVESGPFKCSTCDKSFTKNKYLKSHMKNHETNKQRDPLEPLKCYVQPSK